MFVMSTQIRLKHKSLSSNCVCVCVCVCDGGGMTSALPWWAILKNATPQPRPRLRADVDARTEDEFRRLQTEGSGQKSGLPKFYHVRDCKKRNSVECVFIQPIVFLCFHSFYIFHVLSLAPQTRLVTMLTPLMLEQKKPMSASADADRSVTLHQRISQAAKIRRLRRADPNNQPPPDAEEASMGDYSLDFSRLTGPAALAAAASSSAAAAAGDAASVYQWLLNDEELEHVWVAIEANLLTMSVPPELELPVSNSISLDGSDAGALAAASIAVTAAGERVRWSSQSFSWMCICCYEYQE
jgi:hypothetical protein